MTARTHRGALAATVKASVELQRPEHAALVMLARTLARQADAAGADPSIRLSAAHLSCLKDVQRVTSAAPPPLPDDDGKCARLRAMGEDRIR